MSGQRTECVAPRLQPGFDHECGGGQITAMSITGPNAADFTILSTTCTPTTLVGSNQACNVQFGYTPSSASPEFATFTITDNAPASQKVFSMVGLYTGPN